MRLLPCRLWMAQLDDNVQVGIFCLPNSSQRLLQVSTQCGEPSVVCALGGARWPGLQ